MAIALNLSDPLKGHILQILKEKLSGRIGWLTEYSSDFSDDHDELDAQLISHIVKGIDERMG